MRAPSETVLLIGAIKGWQGPVLVTKDPVVGTPTTQTLDLPDANLVGAFTPGTYWGFLPCQGAQNLDLKLRTSAVSNAGGNVTVDIYRTLRDNVTERLSAAGASLKASSAAFVNGTEQTLQQTSLLSEVGCLVKLTVPVGSSVTFDRAEYMAQ